MKSLYLILYSPHVNTYSARLALMPAQQILIERLLHAVPRELLPQAYQIAPGDTERISVPDYENWLVKGM